MFLTHYKKTEGGGAVVHVILPARLSHAMDKLGCLEQLLAPWQLLEGSSCTAQLIAAKPALVTLAVFLIVNHFLFID